MKKLTALAAAMTVASTASANFEDWALAHVYVDVIPNISITGSTGGGHSSNEGSSGTSSGSNTSGGGSTSGGGTTAGLNWVTNNDLGEVMVGYVEGWVTFEVHANSQQIELACAATDLFKGNVPEENGFSLENPHDDPIRLYEEAGCYIDVPYGNPLNGGNSNVSFNGDTTKIGDWTFYRTDSVVFENNHPEPTQDITLHVKWYQDDPEKRQGQYSGFVKLIAMIPQVL